MSSADAGPPQYVITLVHGTFAVNAKWSRNESFFRQKLEEHLGGPSVVKFAVFNWPGWCGTRLNNSHKYRLMAGESLRIHLESLFQHFPSSHHVIVAHSHGGNVALYSLRERKVRDRVCGIATLGTPFIVCRRRRFVSIYGWLLWMSPLVCLLLGLVVWVVGLAFLLPGDYGVSGKLGLRALTAMILWTLLFLYFVASLASWLESGIGATDRVERWFRYRREQILKRLRVPPTSSLPRLFTLRAKRQDEPGLILRVQQEIADFPRKVWDSSVYPTLGLSSYLVLFVWELSRAFTGRLRLSDMGFPPGYAELSLGQAASLAFALFLFSLIGATLIVFLISLFHLLLLVVFPRLRSNFLGFGTENLFDNLFVHVVAQPLPLGGIKPGKDKDGLYEMGSWLTIVKGRLKHSLYENPDVIRDLADWIRSACIHP